MYFYTFVLQSFALICLLSVWATFASAASVPQRKATAYEIQKKRYFFERNEFYPFPEQPVIESCSAELFDDERFECEDFSSLKRGFCPTFADALRGEKNRTLLGMGKYYRIETALNYGVALGIGAVLANSACDEKVDRWYHKRAYQHETEDLVRFTKVIGNGYYAIPVLLVSSYAYRYWEAWHTDRYEDFSDSFAVSGIRFLGETSSRSAQAIFIGFPTLLLGQRILGASRPHEELWGSDWKFWSDDNGISGHAFIGAVPFITAAQLSQTRTWKTVFYLCSVVVGAGRIHDDHHYLSQVILGWYLAYLSCRAVQQAQPIDGAEMGRGLTVFPVFQRESVGLGVEFRW